MNPLLAAWSASITDLKKNPSAIIAQSEGRPVVILNHNRPAAYLVPAQAYEELMERLYELQGVGDDGSHIGLRPNKDPNRTLIL